jgi:hypothetical protein
MADLPAPLGWYGTLRALVTALIAPATAVLNNPINARASVPVTVTQHEPPAPPGPAAAPATLAPVARARVPFLWLCGPAGVGKSSVGYAIFQQVYRSGIKAAYLDFDQVGLCYPSPADDPHNHRVKAQNLGVVWPTYRAADARCLIAAGGVQSRAIVMTYADQVPDTPTYAWTRTTATLDSSHGRCGRGRADGPG